MIAGKFRQPATPRHICAGTARSPVPHLRRDCAHPCHICAGTAPRSSFRTAAPHNLFEYPCSTRRTVGYTAVCGRALGWLPAAHRCSAATLRWRRGCTGGRRPGRSLESHARCRQLAWPLQRTGAIGCYSRCTVSSAEGNMVLSAGVDGCIKTWAIHAHSRTAHMHGHEHGQRPMLSFGVRDGTVLGVWFRSPSAPCPIASLFARSQAWARALARAHTRTGTHSRTQRRARAHTDTTHTEARTHTQGTHAHAPAHQGIHTHPRRHARTGGTRAL